jgi:hypothetical protein
MNMENARSVQFAEFVANQRRTAMKGWARIAACLIAASVLLAACSLAQATADLYAAQSQVERWKASTSTREEVPAGQHQSLREQDGVAVDGSGNARLDMGGCILRIFRDSNLQVEGLPTDSAPVCVARFTEGTIYNQVDKEMIVNTEFAVIRTLGTSFLVHLDRTRGLLWVIVDEGRLTVQAAGADVLVAAGEQTWVWRGQPPEPVRPATRPEAGTLFPTLESLTNGALADTALLDQGSAPPALTVTIEQNAQEVFAGECGEPRTLQVRASLSAPAGVPGMVPWANLTYQWQGIDAQSVMMERVDDQTFTAEIGPFDYCCAQTTLAYRVEVYGPNREVLGGGDGKALLSYCIQ